MRNLLCLISYLSINHLDDCIVTAAGGFSPPGDLPVVAKTKNKEIENKFRIFFRDRASEIIFNYAETDLKFFTIDERTECLIAVEKAKEMRKEERNAFKAAVEAIINKRFIETDSNKVKPDSAKFTKHGTDDPVSVEGFFFKDKTRCLNKAQSAGTDKESQQAAFNAEREKILHEKTMKPLDYLLKNAKEEANRNAWRHIDATDVSYENTLTLLMNYPSSSAVFGIDVVCLADYFQVIGSLGTGLIGEVYKVKLRNSDSGVFAMKVRRPICSDFGVAYEVAILNDLHGIYFPKTIAYGMYGLKEAFVMELLLKDLKVVFDDYKQKHNADQSGQYFSTNIVHTLLLFMFEAVQSLHDQGFVYLDVKAANFLFVKRKIAGEDVVRLALADFGTSAKVERRMDDCIKRGDMLAIFGIVLNLMFDVGSAYAIIGEDEIFRQKVLKSAAGTKIRITGEKGEKRFIEDPLRGNYQELLKLDVMKDPKDLIKKFIKELRGQKSEADMIKELSVVYPGLDHRASSKIEPI